MQSHMRLALSGAASIAFTLLAGCGANGTATIASSSTFAGNWNIATVAAPATSSQIVGVGGALRMSAGGLVTGTLHTVPAKGQKGSALCYAQASAIPVTGRVGSDNTLTLTSASFAGNTLTVRGTYVAGAGKVRPSLTHATYSIAGPCGVAVQAADADQAAPINATYTGSATLLSSDGTVIPFDAILGQTTDPDEYGTFHLTGLAQFNADPCVGSPVVTDSTVTGQYFNMTYTDGTTGTTIFAEGTLSLDASTLTIYNMTLSNSSPGLGYCSDTATATMTQTSSS